MIMNTTRAGVNWDCLSNQRMGRGTGRKHAQTCCSSTRMQKSHSSGATSLTATLSRVDCARRQSHLYRLSTAATCSSNARGIFVRACLHSLCVTDSSCINQSRGRSASRKLPRRVKIGRRRACKSLAMVNVDFGPGTVLGFGLIAAGYLLVQTRAIKPELSRDADIFLSSVVMMAGGILVFQGWRLDPILLFAQASVITVAASFALETFKLRDVEFQQQEDERKRLAQKRRREYGFQSMYENQGYSSRSLPDEGVVEIDSNWTSGSFVEDDSSTGYVYNYENLGEQSEEFGASSTWQSDPLQNRFDEGEQSDRESFESSYDRDGIGGEEEKEAYWSNFEGDENNLSRWNDDDAFDDSDWD